MSLFVSVDGRPIRVSTLPVSGYTKWPYGKAETTRLAAMESLHWEHEAARAVLAFLEAPR